MAADANVSKEPDMSERDVPVPVLGNQDTPQGLKPQGSRSETSGEVKTIRRVLVGEWAKPESREKALIALTDLEKALAFERNGRAEAMSRIPSDVWNLLPELTKARITGRMQ